MDEQNPPITIAELARERGLFLHDLGPRATICLYNNGYRLPGPKGLRRMSERLQIPPQQLMDVCRAAVARRQAQQLAQQLEASA